MNRESAIRFILNDREVSVRKPRGRLVLDFLRETERLTGTKEGCKEGDCGACTVLLGRLEGDRVRYVPMTACLIPMGELTGKHLVTIEGLNLETLSPIQEAMVDCGGTQCGYCTPGFIVAMTGWTLDERRPLEPDVVNGMISGNLCRCTGYRSIKEAAKRVVANAAPKLNDNDRIADLCAFRYLPEYFKTIPRRLAALRMPPEEVPRPGETRLLIGGGTDLYVQQGADIPAQPVELLFNRDRVPPVHEADGNLVVDARMSFQDFGDDPLVRESIPDIQRYNELIASWPIRTRATLGGNIGNASPAADLTCLLLALDADLEIEGPAESREVALKDFFKGYKKVAKTGDEIIRTIRFAKSAKTTRIHWEKVSKRPVLDIATVNTAARFEVEDSVILEARLAIGGVAPIPLYLKETSRFISKQSVTTDLVFEAIHLAQTEIQPISDVRGSADYKRLLARQLLLAHFLKVFPEVMDEEAVYAAL